MSPFSSGFDKFVIWAITVPSTFVIVNDPLSPIISFSFAWFIFVVTYCEFASVGTVGVINVADAKSVSILFIMSMLFTCICAVVL